MSGWLSGYRSDNSICMSSTDTETFSYSVTRGVPQGCILGPTLFNFSLMRLKRDLKSVEIPMFAGHIFKWCSGRTGNNLDCEIYCDTFPENVSHQTCHGIFRLHKTGSHQLLENCTDTSGYHHRVDLLLTWTLHVFSLNGKVTPFSRIFDMLFNGACTFSVSYLLRIYITPSL